MIRIAKLTDYGVRMMALIAANPKRVFQAREIAENLSITLPTVSKLLKTLVKKELLISHRGANGGYELQCSPQHTTVLDMVHALEGPIAITECNLAQDECKSTTSCHVKAPWVQINQVITRALQSVTLSDLVHTPRHLQVETVA